MSYLPSSYEQLHVPPDMAPITPGDDGRLDSVKASASLLGITFTAREAGEDGNGITVDFADSAGAAASASATGSDITVLAPILGKAATGTIDAGAGEVVLTAEAVGSAANGIVVNFVKRVTIAALPLSMTSSTDGRVFNVYMATDATTDVFASLTTALSGSNNDLAFTSRLEGAYGNGITVAYVNPGVLKSTATVRTDNKAIVVTLATAAGTAALTTALTGANNDLVFTSTRTGSTAGNRTTIAYVDPEAADAELALSFSGDDIIITLATDGSEAITTTAEDIVALIEADDTASAVVTVANAAANDGTGVVTALAETALSGGGAITISSTAAQVKAAIEANVTANGLVSIANAAANNGTGVVTALAATALANGKHADCTSTVAQIVSLIDADGTAGAIIDAAGTGTTSTVVNANYTVTLAGGVDANSVSLGDIVAAILADEDSSELVFPSTDPKLDGYQPTGAEWTTALAAAPISLSGGVDGQWDIEQGFARGIYVETGGDVVLKTMNGEARTITLPDNGILDVAFTSVESTGTTATGIHGRA